MRGVPDSQLEVEELLFYLLLFFDHFASFSVYFLHKVVWDKIIRDLDGVLLSGWVVVPIFE